MISLYVFLVIYACIDEFIRRKRKKKPPHDDNDIGYCLLAISPEYIASPDMQELKYVFCGCIMIICVVLVFLYWYKKSEK